MMLGEHGKQKSPWLIPEDELRQWQQALESCQQWQPQTSRFGNVISWNLGLMFLSEAMPYIARNMDKGAAIVMLQEILIRKGKKTIVQRKLKLDFSEYDCYIAVGDYEDVGKDDDDEELTEEYARNEAQITVVTFLHKRVFQDHALVKNWHKASEGPALEDMSRGREKPQNDPPRNSNLGIEQMSIQMESWAFLKRNPLSPTGPTPHFHTSFLNSLERLISVRV